MRSYRTKQIFFAVVVIIAMSTKPAWSAELIPLRATYASIGGAFAPLWLAQDKGLFNKYGLAVDLKYMLSATGTQALLSGSVDIVNPATELVEAGLANTPRPTTKKISKKPTIPMSRLGSRRLMFQWPGCRPY